MGLCTRSLNLQGEIQHCTDQAAYRLATASYVVVFRNKLISSASQRTAAEGSGGHWIWKKRNMFDIRIHWMTFCHFTSVDQVWGGNTTSFYRDEIYYDIVWFAFIPWPSYVATINSSIRRCIAYFVLHLFLVSRHILLLLYFISVKS